MQSYDQYVDQFENIPADAIAKANDEARKQDLYIITPQYTYDEEGLEKAYEDYMSMTKPFRRRADWITLEFFGLSNQIIYDISKAKCLKLKLNVPEITMNDAVGSGDTPVLEEKNEELSKIIEFNKQCNKFHYGLARGGVVPPDKTVNTSMEDYDKKYRLAKPSQFVAQGGGICWDFVTYEASWFKKNLPGVEYHAYYAVWDYPPNYPTHTFLVFKIGDNWYHFESSFAAIKGIWMANDPKVHINHVLSSMVAHDKFDPSKVRFEIREYNPLNSKLYGMTISDFMNFMNEQPKVFHAYSKSIDKPIKINSAVIKESYVSASDNIDMDNMIRAIMMNRDNLDEQGMYWENQTGFVLLPCHIYTSLESLENKWDLFNLMILKHRRESDWKCQELYGFTNQKYYEWMKAKLMAGDPAQVMQTPASPSYGFSAVREYVDHLIESDDTTRFDLAESLVNIAGLTDTYDEIIAGDIISDAIDKYDGLTNNLATMDLSMNDLPMYTPDEMIDMGVNAMNQTSPEDIGLAGNWFNEYKDYFETGIKTERFVDLNKKRIHELENPFNECDTLAYGWNPDVPFTPANRVLADKRIKAIMAENMTTTQIIDISDMEINESAEGNLDPHNEKKIPVLFIKCGEDAFVTFDEDITSAYSVSKNNVVESLKTLIANYGMENTQIYTIYVDLPIYESLRDYIISGKYRIVSNTLPISTIASKMIAQVVSGASPKKIKLYKVYNRKLADYQAHRINSILKKLEKSSKMYTELANSLTESSFTSISRMSVRDLDMLRTLNESTSIASPNMQTIYSRLISPCLYLSEDTETPIRSNMEITFDLIKPID